ncbi:fibronectin type III domain-containing protein [Hanstruepera flava]|uniref:fibronectin type III domain-containing protein n=1 Tax=Hanstruepera flava TaxID=2930218 RepID=UPI0021D44B82|nr:fibronectin type III domain-containing protein [Hanstruepera flava]
MIHNYLFFKNLKNLISLKIFSLSFLFILISYSGFGQTYTDNTPTGGIETWTVPAGVTSITVECWGAGGAGGGESRNNLAFDGSGGGSGGTYASSIITVTPGQIINYRVGVGGVGDTNDGQNGGNTWCVSNTTVLANGGIGGTRADSGGAGGTAVTTGSFGTTIIVGADGVDGTATAGGNGGNGANGGGTGGAGGNNGDGSNGLTPGGGGGGADTNTNTDESGGNGGDGQVRITYTTCVNPASVNATTSITTTTATINWSAASPAPAGGYDYIVSTDNSTATPGDDTTGNTAATTANITGLTPNTTYYVFVKSNCSSTWVGPETFMTSNVSITNDECTGAIGLTVNTDLNCGVVTAGTNVGATASPQADDVTGVPNDDVWFSFVATSTEHQVSLENVVVISGLGGMGVAVYDGGTAPVNCNALVLEDSQNAASPLLVSGLTIGNTYLVRVYGLVSGSTQSSTFDVCVGTTPPCSAPNTPAGPITFGTVTDDTINATFTGSTPAPDGGYLILMNTTGVAPTDPTDGTSYTIGDTSLGATVIDNDNDTSFSATGLTQTTTYYFFIFAFNENNCNGGPAYSSTSLDGNETTVVPTYCIPSSSSSSNYIDDFSTTNGQTNITNNNTGYSAGGYGDYTSLVASQLPGGNITFNADFIYGFGGMGVGIWVDWNNDLDFDDAGEQIYNSAGYITNLNYTYTIPGIPAGTYRLRIVADYWATSPDPCSFSATGPSGEAEDYSLTIVPLTCTDDPITVTANSTTPTTATISWTHPAPQPANGYEYIISTDNTTGTPGDDTTGTTALNSINLTGLTAGTTYYVFVRGDCGGGDQGIWVSTTFTTACSDTVNTSTICGIIVDESGNDPFNADPFVTDPTAQLDCDNGDVTLQAFSNLRETTSYLVEKITYPSPAPDYDFPTLGNGDNQVISTDDVWASSRTDLDFTFCFYGNTYTQTLVGSNGLITFDSSINPGDFCNWNIDFDIPDTNDLYEQTIYGVMHDIDPFGLPAGAIKSRTIGTAPCRQFQVSWHDIPMFSDATRLYTGMIVLHETSNIIEVFIEEKRIENGNVSPWNDGNAVVGIQGDITPLAPNNEYAVAPCRNVLDDNWEVTNEAWRFTPNGAVISPTSVTWYSASNGGTGGTSVGSGSTLNVSQADTYTAVSQYNLCNGSVTLEDDIVVTDSRKVWNGSVDDEWNRAANWTPNGIPTAIDCIVVPDVTTTSNNSPTLSSGSPPIPPAPGLGRSLRIESNGLVEVQQYSDLVIRDEIYIENVSVPNGKLILRSGSNLIQITNTGITNTGNIQMQRSVSGLTPQDYVYWSSPVDGFDVNDVSPGSSYIYKWIPTIGGNGAGNYGNWQATGETMQDGVGYIIRGVSGTSPEGVAAANTVEFMGTPKNGAITVPISRGSYNGGPYAGAGGTQATALDDNWNLIGNPYPSAILASEFISQNAALDGSTPDPNTPAIVGTVYLWRHQSAPSAIGDPFYGDFVYNYNPNDYIAHNGTGSNPSGFSGNIGSGQAFFVLMDHNASTPSNVVFNNDMRLNGGTPNDNNDFYRSGHSNSNRTEIERHRIWLDLITPNNTANSILVGYVENATNDFDRIFDGYELSETTTRFYSILNDTDLAIQGRALPFDVTDMVPLGIEIPTAGNYSIAINSLDGLFENEEQNIYLEDTYNNFIHDLRLSPYSFTAETGVFNDRFILRYTNNSLGVDEFSSETAITITAPGNHYIKVKASNSPIQSIIVYDVLGRQLYNNNAVNQLEFRIDNLSQSDGVLFVKAKLENGMQNIQKVILKH